MLFQNPSTALYGVVLAVIGRTIKKMNRFPHIVREVDHSAEGLKALSAGFRPIVDLESKPFNLPALFLWKAVHTIKQIIHRKVACLGGTAKMNGQRRISTLMIDSRLCENDENLVKSHES